jgi:septum formation protein
VKTTTPIYLASQSPRRKQLLEQAGIAFEVQVKPTDEHYPPNLPIADIPTYIASQKALAVQDSIPNEAIIIAADTVVVLDDTIIGKPEDRADAIAIIGALSGRQHAVITGVVISKGKQEVRFSCRTEVFFKELSTEEITYYVDAFKPYDKAGAYAIQEWIGAVGIDRIEGCFYNVMGLPISRVVSELKKLI